MKKSTSCPSFSTKSNSLPQKKMNRCVSLNSLSNMEVVAINSPISSVISCNVVSIMNVDDNDEKKEDLIRCLATPPELKTHEIEQEQEQEQELQLNNKNPQNQLSQLHRMIRIIQRRRSKKKS